MVRLTRIYTGGGDRGETSLASGDRAAKHGVRIHAIGEVDEANAAIGLARAACGVAPANADGPAAILARIQNDLFDLGADLAVPGDGTGDERLRVRQAQVDRLEAEIDAANEALAPLESFVLPGGSEVAARLHLARTVARRAERAAWALAKAEPVNPVALVYLNRLSDLLFQLARRANADGADDILWRPGGQTTERRG
jgi:cob(I)alamin adenosyltransferase